MPPYGEFIFGHEYAGDIVAIGRTVDEFQVGDRVVVEAHMGCRRCENCIRGLYTACLNYGNLARGHRANGFTTNGGLAEYALILALIAIIAIVALIFLGGQVSSILSNVGNSI